jgi:GTP-binding protein HflX
MKCWTKAWLNWANGRIVRRPPIPKQTISTAKTKERTVLVGVDTGKKNQGWTADESMGELSALAYSAGAEVVGKLVQKLSAPSRIHYLGKGKLEELLHLKESLTFDSVIVDDELSPQQQEKIEEILETKVIDRVALILDIFARRAKTHEGQLQVELAQYEYNLPRLAGKWKHLERLGGGIGTRGPGESQLETDKRIIRQKITRLKKQLEEVSQQRELYRQRRKRTGIPVVALVGYTNTGKSTLLNALAKSDVIAKNELFSTLDPTTRKLYLSGKHQILLSDTVGFIRKLPPTLIAAFRATLEELSEAALLIHVVDITSHNANEQTAIVESILKDLHLQDKPRITALNKIDLLLDREQSWTEESSSSRIIEKCGEPGPDMALISADKRWGFKRLLEMIEAKLTNQID